MKDAVRETKFLAMWGPPKDWRPVTLLRSEADHVVVRYDSGPEKGVETTCARDTLVSLEWLKVLVSFSEGTGENPPQDVGAKNR